MVSEECEVVGSGRFFGELLRDALDEMSGTVVFAPGEIEADVAELCTAGSRRPAAN